MNLLYEFEYNTISNIMQLSHKIPRKYCLQNMTSDDERHLKIIQSYITRSFLYHHSIMSSIEKHDKRQNLYIFISSKE